MDTSDNLIHKTDGTTVLDDETRILYIQVLQHQRDWLLQKNKSKLILDEEHIREQLHYIDLEIFFTLATSS